jgi:hypothetical protein
MGQDCRVDKLVNEDTYITLERDKMLSVTFANSTSAAVARPPQVARPLV